jgi:hypothetical protein
MTKANHLYDTVTCSALLGVYLFRDGPVVEALADAAPVQFCVGLNRWLQCPGGLADSVSFGGLRRKATQPSPSQPRARPAACLLTRASPVNPDLRLTRSGALERDVR